MRKECECAGPETRHRNGGKGLIMTLWQKLDLLSLRSLPPRRETWCCLGFEGDVQRGAGVNLKDSGPCAGCDRGVDGVVGAAGGGRGQSSPGGAAN